MPISYDFDPMLEVETIKTEERDGPPPEAPIVIEEEHSDEERNGGRFEEAFCSDRAELIERIKRGESPTWVPNQALKQEYLKHNDRDNNDTPRSPIEPKKPSPLLPAAEISPVATAAYPRSDSLQQISDVPIEIQRPKSALHAGDFKETQSPHSARYSSQPFNTGALGTSPDYPESLSIGALGTSPTKQWYTPPPSQGFSTSQGTAALESGSNASAQRRWRSRAPSLNSYSSSSFVLKTPTTPLVQQSNNADLDFSPRERSASPRRSNRRRTLPPYAFQKCHAIGSYDAPQNASLTQSARQHLSYRRESSFLYGHQPRRSLTSNCSLQASNSPQTPPYLRSRRVSFSETSPLQHASMVGSYEESILHGRMSTAPSKPLEFTAQIGVLGKGNHKPKCPAHVTVPFPAVFYCWSAGNGGTAASEDPSPYVGHIDLQQPPPPSEIYEPQRQSKCADAEYRVDGIKKSVAATSFASRVSKRRRRTSPASMPPKGSYRIPQQGQLQIIIKNPNKTAVKLFLVPYDLEGMEPGTKTFVRQRSYSADPVVDSPVFSKSVTDSQLLLRKPTLRYLIHLNICSPSKGRFYLYQQIRVVFANRVPDNKEQLRNDVQLPYPRFSPYKPLRESSLSFNSPTSNKLKAEKVQRSLSSEMGSDFGFSANQYHGLHMQSCEGSPAFLCSGSMPPIPAIPSSVTLSGQKKSDTSSVIASDPMELDKSRPTTSDDPQSPLSDKGNRMNSVQLSSSYKSNSSQGSDSYGKLSRGDSGYGGVFGRPGTPEPGEGLLARRLKGLGMQRDAEYMEQNTACDE